MDAWQYLTVLAACAAVALPLEVIGGARVYRRPRALLVTLAPVVTVFAGWDLIAVHHGDWWFSVRYTLGARLAGLPVEEWLFFLVVPVCALLTYEVLGRGARGAGFRDGRPRHPTSRDRRPRHFTSRDLRSTRPISRDLKSTRPMSRDGGRAGR